LPAEKEAANGGGLRRLSAALRLMAAVALLLAGASCIHPLYGPNGVSAKLAQIQVSPIPDRLGHYLAEELKFQTDGSGAPPPPRYRLDVTVTESASTLITDIHTLSADAAIVTLNATYSLVDIATGREVTKGSLSSVTSYDRTEQRFANVRAARDAEIRAVNVLAEQLRTKLGIALLEQK
jgi:LPS-assembly lipoprotein